MKKRIVALMLSVVMLLVSLPSLSFASYAVTSNEVTALGKQGFNLASCNTALWSFDDSWGGSCITLSEGALGIANGRATYFGFAASSQTLSFTYNSLDATDGSFTLLFRNALNTENLTNNSGAAAANKGGAPFALNYTKKGELFLQSYDSEGNATQLKNSAGANSGTEVSLANGEDRVIKIVTVEDTENNTTAISVYIDGQHKLTSYADCIKTNGYLTFGRYVANSPVKFSNICIDGLYYDPYYAVEGYTADFEAGEAISTSGNATVSNAMAHSGEYSVYVDDTSAASGYFALGTKTQASLLEDMTYRVTAWVRPGDTQASKNLEYNIYESLSPNSLNVNGNFRPSGIKVTYNYSTAMNEWGTCLGEDENGWRKILITKNYTLTEGKENYSFPFFFTWSTAGGSGWYIDDIEFSAVADVNAVSENEEMGSVTVTNNEYINIATKASKDYVMAPLTNALGDSLTFSAQANAGYRFSGWYDGNVLVSTKASYTFTLTGAVNYTAHFEKYDSSYVIQDFEDTSLNIKLFDGNPSYWNIDTAAARNGEYGLHLDRVTYPDTTMGFVALFGEDSLALESSRTYVISFWAKPVTVSANASTLEFTFYAAPEANNASSGRTGQSHYTNKLTLNYNTIIKNAVEKDTNGWYKYVIAYEYKPTDELPYMTFTTWIPNAEEWYFDDFEFTQVCKASVSAAEGGSAYISATEMNGGDEVMALAVPERGYTFEGWYENGEKIADASASYRFYASLDLHALEARFTGESPEYPEYSRDEILNGDALAFLDSAIMREGNNAALASALLKAQAGQELTVDIIGGAAALGIGTSSQENTVALQLENWLNNRFECSDVHVNTIGFDGAGSRAIVGEVQKEISCDNPDIVILDLASVDTADDADAFETIVRTALSSDCAVLINISAFAATDLQSGQKVSGQNMAAVQLAVADYYDLTVLCYERALWTKINEGIISWYDVSHTDDLYNDTGYKMLSKIFCYYLGLISDNAQDISLESVSMPEDYYFNDTYEGVSLFDAAQITPLANTGFAANNCKVDGLKAWEALQADAVLTFYLESCKGFSIVYGNGIDAVGEFYVSVDGVDTALIAVNNSGNIGVTEYIPCFGRDVNVTVTASKGCRIAGVNVGLQAETSERISAYRSTIAALTDFTYGTQEALCAAAASQYDTLTDYEKTLAADNTIINAVSDAALLLDSMNAETTALKFATASSQDNGRVTYKYLIDSNVEADYRAMGFTAVASGAAVIPTALLAEGEALLTSTVLSASRQFTRAFIGKNGRFNITVKGISNDLRQGTALTAVPYTVYRIGELTVKVYSEPYTSQSAIDIANSHYQLITGSTDSLGASALEWLSGH